MTRALQTVLRRSLRQSYERLNILFYPSLHQWDSPLLQTGHQFFAPVKPSWSEPAPDNLFVLPDGVLPSLVDFDLCLCQRIDGSNASIRELTSRLHLYVITHWGDVPSPEWPESWRRRQTEACLSAYNVVPTKSYQQRWGLLEKDTRVLSFGDIAGWCDLLEEVAGATYLWRPPCSDVST